MAKVGNVDNSMTGHIHFVVRDASNKSQPISFKDVKEDSGIPRTFNSYKSGNATTAKMVIDNLGQ